MIGQTISHYRITEKLGEGGMGEVYKAEDLKLGRCVALKFLAPHLLKDKEAHKRFEREARAAATLNHPNICTIHEIDEADGTTFLAMEFIEGESLDRKIETGPLPLEEALDIACQVSDALGYAHEKGVVHRDIKPANLFVTASGRSVILDFGLAQLASAGSKLTQEGTTLGTIAYMSPEQASGSEIDARSDVWSLGCVLYEMLSGRPPFRGDYAQAIIYWILNEAPEPLEAVSAELQAIVRRCLSKDREERYTDGRELHRQLLRQEPASELGSSTTGFEIPRVAVLPLKTRGLDAELASVAEGLTEEVTSGLSQFRHLAVVSASAAAHFQGTVDVRQVGKELDARFVLSGSIRKAGLSIRVSIELVDALTGDQLWAERLDRDLGASDIFQMQDELTDRIVATVADSSGVLTRSLAALVRTKPVETLTAAECVLLTFAYWEQVRPDLHAEVRIALERAVKQEPRHAEAWACLSRVYLDEYRFGFNVLADALDRALQAGRAAVELDATSQNAYRSLAEAHYYRREFSAFRAAAERVLALNPRDTSNIGMTSQLIAYGLGDWARGRAISERVVEMNPHHAGWLNFMFVHDHYRRGEYEQALDFAEKVNMPGYNWASGILAAIHGQLGNVEAAHKHVQMFVALAPDYARNFRPEGLKWFASEEFIDHMNEGLRKAGLDDELRRLDAGVSQSRP